MRAIKSFSQVLLVILLFSSLLSFNLDASSISSVYISDVFPNPATSESNSIEICGERSEWVVLSNANNNSSIDISGFTLSDGTVLYTAPISTSIPAGGTLEVCLNSINKLTNTGETLNLIDLEGMVCSTVTWDSDPGADKSAGSDCPSHTAGDDASHTVCGSTVAQVILFGILTGADTGGTWTGITLPASPADAFDAQGGEFNTNGVAVGTYTFKYSMASIDGCPTSESTVSVTIEAYEDAGTDGSLSICETSVSEIDLTSIITGEDASGTWSANSANPTGGSFTAATGSFDPTGASVGTYNFDYTIAAGSACLEDKATATVTVSEQVDLGLDAAITVCNEDAPSNAFDLIDKLSTTVTGGVWSETTPSENPSSELVLDDDDKGSVDFQGVTAGIYTFTYTVESADPCADATADVVVTVTSCFDLALTKKLATTGAITPGGNVTFDIEVYNQGTIDAFDVDVKDFIPSCLTFTSVSFGSQSGSGTDPTVTPSATTDGEFTISTIPHGESVTAKITFSVSNTCGGMIDTNNAEISDASSTAGGATAFDADSVPGSEDGIKTDPNDDDITNTTGNDDYDGQSFLIVAPPGVCDIEIIEATPTCQGNGKYDLEVCFSHTEQITNFVCIQVGDDIVVSNLPTTGGIDCYTIEDAGLGDGSTTVPVLIREKYTAPSITEIHYDNNSTDVGEGVEITGPANSSLNGFSLVHYNGSNGMVLNTVPLSGALTGSGCSAIFFDYPLNGLQNGPDGIALVDASNNVIEFLSYEGAFMGAAGPASGVMSTNIGVAESPSAILGTSMQLTDAGWVTGVASSYGVLNENLSCPDFDFDTDCFGTSAFNAPICDIVCGDMACNNKVQVSLGNNCIQCITPDMVLEGTYEDYENYTVVISNTDGTPISPDASCVGLEHAGLELMVSVQCGENSCWGVLQIEDKLPPQFVNCDAIQTNLEAQFPTDLLCSDLNADWDITVDLPDSIIIECNNDFTVTTEQGLTGDMCDSDYRWTKKYIIEYPQAHGGRDTSHACIISLPVASISLTDIICPDDQEISCRATNFSPNGIFAIYSDTTDAYAITQAYPYIINTSGDTVQLTSEHCNILSNYADTELPICQFKRKQIRKWTFIDWCTSQVRVCDQVIKMIDNEVMACAAPPEFDIPLGAHCSIDSTVLPSRGGLVIYSGCGNVIDTTIYYKSKAATREAIDDSPFELKAIKKADGTFILPPVEAPFDSIWLKYEFTNACGEICSAFTEARVIDNTPPTPVCNPDVVVAFSDLERGNDGLVKIYADAFDADSHDNSCGPVYFKIVRQAELNGAPDGYWNNSGAHGAPDYSLPPIANINRFCDSANGDDFGDITLNGSQLVSTGNQFWFDDHIKLCCTDDNFKVMMRVFDIDPGAGPVDPRRMHSAPTQITGTTEVIDNDLYGHFNDCWVDLEVQDKTQILGACTPFSLFCDEYPDNPMDNAPQINMTCSNENVRLISRDSTNISECGNGLVIRDWYARRSSGDEIKVCTQSIILQSRAFDPYSIKWPKSYVDGTETGRHLYRDTINDICLDSIYQVPLGGALDCSDDVNSCEPTWDKTACSLLGMSSLDDTLFVDGDACMKIIRTWSVIDWCIYNENTSRDNSDNSDKFEALLDDCEDNCDPNNVYFRFTDVNTDGFYTYQQVLKIVDDQAPVLNSCETRSIDITEGCTTKLNISKTATDGTGCGQSFLKWIAILKDTTGRTLGTYPGVTDNADSYEVETRAVSEGIYTVTWIVEDACGNESSCEEQYLVKDTKAPTPICVRDLSTVLMPSTGSLAIWAVDYDLKSEDNCGTPRFSFSPDSIQTGITLTCDDMDGFEAKTFGLKVYVYDDAGNADFCVVSLRVDSKDICDGTGEGGSAAIIQGHIATENGEMVSSAQAMVNTNLPEYPHMIMTQDNGEFAFGDNPLAYDYDLSVEKDGDDVNGVSTLDIVLIQKHILGLSLLDSPYKVIAADANNDQKVSASDLVQIRKLILGVTESYPTNSSWRFVDADQTFSSIYSPWPFTEVINLGNLNDHKMHEDFIGIKVGDVNGNVTANSRSKAEVRSAGTLTFNIEDRKVKAGEEFSVAFSADNFDQVSGYQLTLSHDGLSYVGVSSNVIEMTTSNVATFEDHLTMSWNSENSVISDDALFSLKFRADRDMKISDALAINSRRTIAEAYYSESLSIYDIALSTDDVASNNTLAESVFSLHQNQPNPFVSETTISFVLPEDNEASLSIMDVTGKLIMKITDIYQKGYNEVSLRSDEIESSGLIYYQLESGKHIATKKMIIIE